VLLKVRAVELRECCFNISGCKLSALATGATYPDAVASVSDDELTDADFWRGALEIRGDGGAGNFFFYLFGWEVIVLLQRDLYSNCSRLQRAGVKITHRFPPTGHSHTARNITTPTAAIGAASMTLS
jgi:hypothetical protein